MKRANYSFIIISCLHVWVGLIHGAVFENFGYDLINEGTEVRINGYTSNTPASIVIPSHIEGKSVTEIGDWAFYADYELTEVIIPESVVRIGDWAFGGCFRITSLALPESLEEIGIRAFYSLGINRISIPQNVHTIGSTAFWQCDSLEHVFISSSVTNIGSAAFSNCNNLTSIEVDISNPHYSSQNNVLFNKPQTRILTYPSGRNGAYSIPFSVLTIDDYAFYNSDGLTSVSVPMNTKYIGEWAFYSCDSLASLSPIYGVESIGYRAFTWCSQISAIQFSDNLLSVGTDALKGTNIPLHEENNLRYLVGDSTAYLIDGIAAKGDISVPTKVIDRRVMSVNAFRDNDELTGITLPDGLNAIGTLAFQGCSNLTYVEMQGNRF